jgi:hypothetical protein
VDPTVAEQLRGVADQDYIAFAVCACNTTGACYSACKADFCAGQNAGTACNTGPSLMTTAGCGPQETACANH